ncbi:cytochrome P450 [Bisporella sp. PMI_857]|nr:cytochrome P450 [Bisporella sp. PMI_857]
MEDGVLKSRKFYIARDTITWLKRFYMPSLVSADISCWKQLTLIVIGLTTSLLTWITNVIYCLAVNDHHAKKAGLPLVILPIDSGNPLVHKIQGRYEVHEELGDAYIFVTPGKNWLQLCDPEALSNAFSRKEQFTQPPTEMLKMLDVFGHNLGTNERNQWKRHRKIRAACLNENNNLSRLSINSVADDARTVSLHVLSGAGFGKSYPFRGAEETTATHDFPSHKDSLKLILDKCIPLVLLGPQNLGKSTVTFRNYMTEVYETEKKTTAQGKRGGNNLATSLVRNIFGFNSASHHTTANTLAFGIVLIATLPDVQDWIADEINYVFGDVDVEKTSYTESFPRLKRSLAVVSYYETVRLYTSVAMVKTTGPQQRPLKIGEELFGVTYHPRHWGKNPLDWEPSRWITTASIDKPEKSTTANSFASESFLKFPESANLFAAWSGGARVCPGRKFSQVEFAGVLLIHEGVEEARKRLSLSTKEDTGMRLLLQLLHPEKALLVFEKRT